MATPSDKTQAKPVGPELRLIDRRAFVGFPELVVAPGVVLSDFALLIPEVSFPFNVTGGAARYQKRRLDFGFLELSLEAEVIVRRLEELAKSLSELSEVRLHFRPGYLEGQGLFRAAGEVVPLTFKVAFDGDGERLVVYVYDLRLYGFCPTPSALMPVQLARAVQESGLLPELELRGAHGFSTRVLPGLVQLAAVGRGFKMPSLDQARLSAAEVSTKGLKLRFSAGGLPPPSVPDEDLLLTLEGARTFADAEELLAEGKLAEAREAYLKLGDAREAHPFAAERLLSLLVADPQAHDLALDVAASLARRREKSAAAAWAEAVIRERRGEAARAAERYLAICGIARRSQEEASAFFSAEAAARAARDHAPQIAARALHELLGLRPDHLPSLRALARASDLASDRAGAIRAYRRIAALARDSTEAADAHVHMARLCALTEDDVAGARLHCEAALKLAPDHPEALCLLGELCHRSGEHLRAIKALDRAREVFLGRHEVDRIGRTNLLTGQIWETGLNQPENALLRYREAVSLLPADPEPHFFAARVAERLDKLQEALAGYQQAIELAGPAPSAEPALRAAHQSHHALARLAKNRLGDPARSREHLEHALRLDPGDMRAIEELLPYFRATGRAAELADACEKAAIVERDPARRAAYWAEAAELCRARLGKPEKAEKLFEAALESDARNRTALEGMLALAESRRDGAQLGRCLKALSELAQEPAERVRYLRRLAVASRDLAFDLELAAHALSEVLKIETDDLSALGELCALQRRRADMAGLAAALEHRARAAEKLGDAKLASSALRELAGVLEARLGRVGDALVALEKAARLAPEPQVLFDLANLSLRCERPTHARRALEDLLLGLGKQAAPDRVAEVKAVLGRACEQAGDPNAALEHYAQAFPRRRLDDELAARLEALYAEAGRHQDLVDLWAARAQALLTAGRPSDAAPLFLRAARALIDQNDRAGAILRLTAALDAAPQGSQAGEVLEAMAELEQARGQKLEAAKLLGRRARLHADARAAARTLLRASTLAAGTPREQAFLAEALDRDPRFPPARVRRAELALETDPKLALADLEVALTAEDDADALSDEFRVGLLRQAVDAAVRVGALDTARRHLALYCARRPTDLEAARQLVELHRKAGATEALGDLLAELWPRTFGAERRALRREYAELSLARNRVAEALGVLRALREEDPTDLWATRTLLDQLPDTERELPERLSLVGQLLAPSSGDERAGLLQRRARLLERSGRTQEALADLEAAADCAASPGPLLKELAEAAAAAGEGPVELSAWKRAVVHDAALGPVAAPRLLELAQARLGAGDFSVAREGFSAALALELDPKARQIAFLGLADAATGAGDLIGAADCLAQASVLGTGPERREIILRRAALLEQLERHAEAGDAYELALTLLPKDPVTVAGLKRTLRAQEDWEGLAEVLAAEAARAPTASAPALFSELASLYLDRLDQVEAGIAALKRVVALDARAVGARRQLAELLFARGDVKEASDVVEEAAAELAPAEGAALLRSGAVHARARGELGLALRLARQAQQLVPGEGAELAALADLLYVQGAVQEALPLQQRLADAARFDDAPEDAEVALLRLGDLAEQVGDFPLAEKTYRRLLAERPLCEAAVGRLAVLLAPSRPREALELRAAFLLQLSASERTAAQLVELATAVRADLADAELAGRLLHRAARMCPNSLEVRRALVAFLRDAGRVGELLGELDVLAGLERAAGHAAEAADLWLEGARLAEESGRVDEALATLAAVVERCLEDDELAQAAVVEQRRAELLRDAKLDLDASARALDRSFELQPRVEVARLARALALRRGDREVEVEWLEREVDLEARPAEKARAFVELAKLHLGFAPPAVDQAEAALRAALALGASDAAESSLRELLGNQGRFAELAALDEAAAARASTSPRRAQLLIRAADIYQQKAGRPQEAVTALLAARAACPDDAVITQRTAELLHQLGRAAEAAEFDALLLEQDPFHSAFDRHIAYLVGVGEAQEIAALHLRRAVKQEGREAAVSLIGAARAFHQAGAQERARLCEQQAFDADPANDDAFVAVKAQAENDVRRMCAALANRARAVPAEAGAQLAEAARLLAEAGESLRAAEAYDQLLALEPDDLDALRARGELAAAAGGPAASRPFDRRLVQLAGDELPADVAAKVQLRLGHAALDAGAYQDAVDALSVVRELEPEGPRGREALSLMAEAHARSGNVDGQYQTTLELARRSSPAETEALLRRAASLYEVPEHALDALALLSQLRPADVAVVERAALAFAGTGRHVEQVELLERCAQAVGGAPAAELLLSAADVVEAVLGDTARAEQLRQRAGLLDPQNLVALRAVAAQQRRRGDRKGLLATLLRLAEATAELDAAALIRLEIGQLASADGDDTRAREALQGVIDRGSGGAGYQAALEAYEALCARTGDDQGRGRTLALRSELAQGRERAGLLLSAAKAYALASDDQRASSLARQALTIEPSVEGLRLLAAASTRLGEHAKAASALAQVAHLSPPGDRPKVLLEALEAWERAAEPAEARELLERLATEHPGFLSVHELGDRFARLGDAAGALAHAFGPAMAAGEHRRALELADAANDAQRARQALRALALEDAWSDHASRFLEELRAAKDVGALFDLARELEARGVFDRAGEIFLDVALEAESLEQAQAAIDRLAARGSLLDLLERAVARGGASVVETVLGAVAAQSDELALPVIARAAELLPERRKAMLQMLYQRHTAAARAPEAQGALEQLVRCEEDVAARAALRVELAALVAERDPELSRRELEVSVAEVRSPLALRRLAEFYRGGPPERFVALVEELRKMSGEATIAPFKEDLVSAYLAVGRKADAHRLAGELPETPARLAQRADLARELGLGGEALLLRERLTDDRAELELILLGYLEARLHAAAVRLAARLLKSGPLAHPTRRQLAERLANTPEGAALAAELWPELLHASPRDADGWTLFGEALTTSGRLEAGLIADGFGAALVGSHRPSAVLRPAPIDAPASYDYPPEPAEPLWELDERSMPRLFVVLSDALEGLGAAGTRLQLDEQGGAWAYLRAPNRLVLGAGALAVFGAGELTYLLAVALALGDRGHDLTRPGPVRGLDLAVRAAFEAYPSSLAACRVIAHLDDASRGADASRRTLGEVLGGSTLFDALAQTALALVGRPQTR